jgi:GTP-binding protein Era
MVFVDTPGIHRGGRRLLNRVINEAALAALGQVDLVVFVVDRTRWSEEDAYVLERIREAGRPAIAVVNKVDAVDKQALLPTLAALQQRYPFEAYVPVSARRGTNLDALKAEIRRRLPEGPFLFPEDQVSSRSERFIAAELIREQLVRTLRDEVPHAVYVEIESMEARANLVAVAAVIWVERASQRAIVIGRKGAMLKKIGTRARQSLESFFGRKVHLELWVKDKAGWQDNPSVLAGFDTTGF